MQERATSDYRALSGRGPGPRKLTATELRTTYGLGLILDSLDAAVQQLRLSARQQPSVDRRTEGKLSLQGHPRRHEDQTQTSPAYAPNTTYYYAIAARDNVSKRLGPRSEAVKAKTRSRH